MDAASETEAQIAGARGPATSLVGDVVFHACVGIDLELARVDGAAQSLVILTGILTIGIAKGIVDVLLRSVDAEALLGDLKFLRGITIGQKGQDPYLWLNVRNGDAATH